MMFKSLWNDAQICGNDVQVVGGGYANPPIRAILWPDPSIRRYFRSNPDPHYLKTFRGINKLHMGIYLFSFSSTVFRSYPKFSVFASV